MAESEQAIGIARDDRDHGRQGLVGCFDRMLCALGEGRVPEYKDCQHQLWDLGWSVMRSGLVVQKTGEPVTLADVRPLVASAPWVWEGFIPAGRISGIAAPEGVGKTRLALDLARRVWHGMPWPDGQPPRFPPGTPTLWVCADGQQAELCEAAQALGLPEQALYLNSTREDPLGGAELDSEEARTRLEFYIARCQPALVFIDTLTNATTHDLCRPRDVVQLTTPLRIIAQRTQTAIVTLLHLNRNGQALGLRIKPVTRTIIHLERPDREQPERLRLWVEKTYSKHRLELGVTMTDSGNEYDFDPPEAASGTRRGHPADPRESAKQFIRRTLGTYRDLGPTDICRRWQERGESARTFWRARDEMIASGELVCKGSPRVLSLNACDPDEVQGSGKSS
jgi:hypothetical protein